jgi:CDP-4-dehydro-6-deoxyglucose reductase, E3
MTFKVTVQPAGLTFDVARDEPMLAAAIRAGIGLPYGCRDGACGSCKSRLVEGRVIHGAHQLRTLSVADEEQGWILPCCATPQTDCVIQARTVAGAGEYPVQKMPARVAALTRAAPDVVIMKLQLPANVVLKYRAGQYLEFILRDGARRSYSMANAPEHLGEPPQIELHLRHMPGGKFTDHVFGAMKEKEILRVEGPLGSFFLREDSSKAIARDAVLYWGCRNKADLYLHDWALQAAADMPNLRYVPVLSEARPEDAWSGRTGLVHQVLMSDLPDLSGHEVYACGAPIMVESAQRDLVVRCALPDDAFFADSFTSERDKHGDAPGGPTGA